MMETNAALHSNHSPDDDYDHVIKAIEHLSKYGPDQNDFKGLANQLGLTERQMTELFRRWCGLSPKNFAQAVALDHAKHLLAQRANILDTTFEVGLSSTSRLHDLFVTYQAMPPGVWASEGAGLTMQWGRVASPFGQALIFTTSYGVAGIGFVGEAGELAAYNDLANRWKNATFLRNDAHIAKLAPSIFDPQKWDPKKPVRIVMIGTDFEISVWETLMEIPMGSATSYGALAKQLGKPKSARAVGAAVGRNPISFVVPCHRVVGATGKLTGYHWGVARKRAILGWETGVASQR